MISRERVLGFRLRGHHLDRRVRGPAEAVAACGVRTTPPGSAPAALAARVADLPAGRVDAALASGELLEVLGPRFVPTLVVPQDAAVFTAGALPADAASLRVSLGDRADDALDDSVEAVRRTAEAAREALAGGPLPRGEVSAAVTRALPPSYSTWCQRCGSTHVHDTLFRAAGAAGAYAVSPRSGRTVLLMRLDLPAAPGARLELVRRFLRCCGPATPADFAAWANTGVPDARQRWSDLGSELAAVEWEGGTGSVLASDVARLQRSSPPSGVRLLPPNDPYLLIRDRQTLVPDAAARTALWPALSGPGAVLVDGEIAGTWRARKKGTVLHLRATSFAGPLPSLDAEAALLAPHRTCTTAEVTLT